ncbi:hypothetical protein BGZ88_001815 [Linnemannia elongata]|nr:hypothetical protein BGZ88_001815 [Linnemannia elongata]
MEINPAFTFNHDRSIMYATLIVGAGLGDLTLGMLLHKANIPYVIYELLFYDCHWFDAVLLPILIFLPLFYFSFYAVKKSLLSKFTRAIIKRIPAWLLRKMESQQLCHHPQVAFLPLVEDKGTFRPGPQPSVAVKAPQEETAAKFTAGSTASGPHQSTIVV